MRTDHLIDLLAQGAEPVPARSAARRLGLALLVGLPMAAIMLEVDYGFRSDLAEVATWPAFWVKLLFPLLIGLAAGLLCYFMVAILKGKLGYDDSLDAFGVHGAGGTLGAILTGVFATNEVNNALKDSAGKAQALGLVDGNGGQVVNQLIGSAIAWGLAIVGTLIILKICDIAFGLRVESDEETQGLDLSMHGEEAYNLES